MDLAGRLEQLQELIREAKSMPLSSSVLVNRDEVAEMISDMQEALPEEIKRARWIVRDREELLAKARAEGERIVEQAQEEQLRMARKEEIMGRATEEADRVVAEAEERARAMQAEAEDYVDAKLASFEVVLQKTLAAVVKGRESLQGRLEMSVRIEDEYLQEPEHVASMAGMAGSGRGRRRWSAS
jgi:cell division septum initiation protein DivIVA